MLLIARHTNADSNSQNFFTMSSSQATRLADEPGRILPQDHNIVTTPDASLEAVSNRQPRQTTLLGIPRELRNKIFEYVYATPHSVSITVTTAWSPPFNSEASTSLSQAPPCKDPILVCRQLYAEMGKMQARAFRQYWSNTVFEVSLRDIAPLPASKLYIISDDNLKHVEHFVIPVDCRRLEAKVECRFKQEHWTAFFEVSEDLWKTICDCRSWVPYPPAPQRLQRLAQFGIQMRMNFAGTLLKQPISVDPTIGSGLAAEDMYDAIGTAKYLIMEGPLSGNWAAVQSTGLE